MAGGIVAGVGGVVAVAGTGAVVGTQIANKCHNTTVCLRELKKLSMNIVDTEMISQRHSENS